MGILDKVAALLPGRSERREPSSERGGLLRRDDPDRWWPWTRDEPGAFPTVPGLGWMPSADVHETDGEVVVTMEVPGLDRDDLDLVITPGGLIVRGEKREREDARKDYHVTELRYGSFVRTVPLPPGLDVEGAKARVANGVLTVRFPKVADRAGVRRVPIKT